MMFSRARLHKAVEPKTDASQPASWFNVFIACVVILSFVSLALETEPTLSDALKQGVQFANLVFLVIFALEYVLRFWVCKEDARFAGPGGRLKFVFTPYALADLIAFLPELIILVFFPNALNDGSILMLRILRLARLFKIARIFPAFEIMGATLQRAGGQLLSALTLALMLVYISAVMLYLVEGVYGELGTPAQENFNSIPRAIWWAVATLTTVGYGDVYPVTNIGRLFASVIAIAGVGVVALPAGVFASAFTDELSDRREAKLPRSRAETKETDHGR